MENDLFSQLSKISEMLFSFRHEIQEIEDRINETAGRIDPENKD
jgi:hypothetical protein